jgi:hypothetical protein
VNVREGLEILLPNRQNLGDYPARISAYPRSNLYDFWRSRKPYKNPHSAPSTVTRAFACSFAIETPPLAKIIKYLYLIIFA